MSRDRPAECEVLASALYDAMARVGSRRYEGLYLNGAWNEDVTIDGTINLIDVACDLLDQVGAKERMNLAEALSKKASVS